MGIKSGRGRERQKPLSALPHMMGAEKYAETGGENGLGSNAIVFAAV